MNIVKTSIEPMGNDIYTNILSKIETAARTCYKSTPDKKSEAFVKRVIGRGSYEAMIARDSEAFVKRIIDMGHEAMIEHASLTYRIICDRGVSHELVRHRLASFAQESTRYCNYSKDKFGNELTFIDPRPAFGWADENENGDIRYHIWKGAMSTAEVAYLDMIKYGATPQEARSVLPNSLKTEVVMTANMREWRHFLRLRTAKDAHPQMREVALLIYKNIELCYPVFVSDISVEE